MLMKTAYSLVRSPGHSLPDHPENESRFAHFNLIETLPFYEELVLVEPQSADRQVLELVHPPSYLDALADAASRGPGYIDPAPTYLTPDSYQAALLAAGACLQLLSGILAPNTPGRAFALVRPPGHHALADRAMGFCLLNNIAICARFAQQLGFARVMIVDLDVHHGNGTQAIFEEDAEICYLSTHQRGSYPGTGLLTENGVGAGADTVINLPLPAHTGDRGFQRLMEAIIRPAINRFSPQLLLVSAGFDAHWRDPLASLQLSSSGYHSLLQQITAAADEHCAGRLLVVLEGGYDPLALSHSAAAVFAALHGEPAPPDPLGAAPNPEPDLSSLIEEGRRRFCL